MRNTLILYVLLLVGFFCSCSIRKKHLSENIQTQDKSITKSQFSSVNVTEAQREEYTKLIAQTQTFIYSDTLKGSQIMDSGAVVIESSGIKLNAHLIGNRLNYTITAKPISKTTTNTQNNINATEKVASKSKTQIAEENTANAQANINRNERETTFPFPGWVTAIVCIIAIIALVLFFKPIINFIKLWNR